MSKIVGIAFDFDGTLVQSNEIKRETYYLVAKEAGCPSRIVDKVLADDPRGDRHRLIRTMATEMGSQSLLESGILPENLAHDITARYSELCELAIASCPEVEGASEALRELRNRNIGVFLNSATPKNYLESVVQHRSFVGEVSGIFGAPASKVDNIDAIVSGLKCTADEIMVVGDGQDDLEAARATGCYFVGIRGGSGGFAKEAFPIVTDLLQLLPLIEGLDDRWSLAPLATNTEFQK